MPAHIYEVADPARPLVQTDEPFTFEAFFEGSHDANGTSDEGHADVWTIGPGHTFGEFTDHVDRERALLGSGSEPTGEPAYITLVTTVEPQGGGAGFGGGRSDRGDDRLRLRLFDGETGTMYAAGSLEVEG